jgi:predicted MFS family arabinose efflux permease
LSRIVNRLDRKKIFITAAILVILGNILTILAPTLNYVILARVISGLGSGAIVATVVATIARGSNAQMTFALLNSGVGVMGVLLPFCLPIIIASNGMNGAYSFHLFISLFTFLFISFLTLSSSADDNQNTVSSYKGYAGWASMIGTSLIFLGHAGIFAFSAKIGATLGISVIQVGYVFMAGGLLTIFGPLLAGFIGQRFGSLFPCLILITILLVTGIILANVTSALIFFIVVPLCGMIPMILTPFFLGGMAKLDPSGSLAAAHPAFSTMGGAAGPVVMGYTIDMAGFTSIGWVLIVMVIVGTPLISLGLIEADKIKT